MTKKNETVVENIESETTVRRGRPAKYTEDMSNDELKSAILSDAPAFSQTHAVEFLATEFGITIDLSDYRVITNSRVMRRIGESVEANRPIRVVEVKRVNVEGLSSDTLAKVLAMIEAEKNKSE